MSVIHPEIAALVARIAYPSDTGVPWELLPRLSVTAAGDMVDLDFYGDPFSEAYLDVLGTLAKLELAACLRSLSLRGPDDGANGTKNWDLEPLFAYEAVFPRLESFSIQQTAPGDHNRSIVANDYEEDGVIARLIKQSPRNRPAAQAVGNRAVPSARCDDAPEHAFRP